jgi:predicted dehydrogenase
VRDRLTVGVVGAGAVAELCHLPALKRCPEVGNMVLVDTDRARSQSLAQRFGISEVRTDYRDVFGDVDAAIIALPNYLHAPVAIDFLNAGIPVLVEKPLATNGVDAEAVVATASARAVLLQVGLMYRFCSGASMVKSALDQDWLGPLTEVSLEWGYRFEWPAASGSFYDREHAGGGVLLDMGSHALDLLSWWLGPLRLVEYRDDSRGGVEADCTLTLSLGKGGGDTVANLTLSRLRDLDNRVRLVGERFVLEYDFGRRTAPRLWPRAWTGEEGSFLFDSDPAPARASMSDLYLHQLRSFLSAVQSGSPPAVPGTDSVPVLGLIDQCYRERRQVHPPWELPARTPTAAMQSA